MIGQKSMNGDDHVSSLICYTEDGDDLRITWGKRKETVPPQYSISPWEYMFLPMSRTDTKNHIFPSGKTFSRVG